MEISAGTGILASVVFIVLIGLSIVTLIMFSRDTEIVGLSGIERSTILFAVFTLVVAIFLAIILGFVPADLGISESSPATR